MKEFRFPTEKDILLGNDLVDNIIKHHTITNISKESFDCHQQYRMITYNFNINNNIECHLNYNGDKSAIYDPQCIINLIINNIKVIADRNKQYDLYKHIYCLYDNINPSMDEYHKFLRSLIIKK